MFGRKASTAAITKYLDTYQQNENLPQKMYKNLSSTFMKAIKKKESEVTEKLAEGNENDHTRHEDYILSYIGEPLRTQVYSYINRGVSNAKTIQELKKYFNEDEYTQLLNFICCEMKTEFVEAQKYIYELTKESATTCNILILLRHGEGTFTAGDITNDLEYFSCVDLLGVKDYPYINDNIIKSDTLSIVSRSPCIVSILSLSHIIDCVKKLDVSSTAKNNALSYLLARSVRLAQEEERKRKEEELARQEEERKRLAEWKDYLKAGNEMKVEMYLRSGLNINTEIGTSRDTPIILAMYSKNLELINFLINMGANLSIQNDQGLTALHVGCQIGWLEGVKRLIDIHAPMLPDNSGNLPTHIAAQQNNRSIIMLFVDYQKNQNLDVNWYVKNNAGDTVIDACVDYELKKIIVPKGKQGYTFSR